MARTMEVTGKNPALCRFKRTVVMPNPIRPKGAGLASLFSADLVFSFFFLRRLAGLPWFRGGPAFLVLVKYVNQYGGLKIA
jgi:hypothetical protein